MRIPMEWQLLLERQPNLKKLFVAQEKEDIYGEAPVPPYLFHYFRPDKYDLLKGLFVPFKHGKEVFNRLKEIYEVTRESYVSGMEENFSYFRPKLKREITTKEVTPLVLRCMRDINCILKDYGQTYRVQEENIMIQIMEKQEFNRKFDIDDIIGDEFIMLIEEWYVQLEPDKEKNPIVLFNEAFYQIAADRNITRYISWPITGRADLEDPYKGYFDLWKLGYVMRVVAPDFVVLTYAEER